MPDPVFNALDFMTMEGLDRPSYIEDPEEAIEQNRIDEYLRLLPALTATERRSQATIGPKETGPIEDLMSYIYTQPKAGPIIAALDDLTPGIPFHDVIPDPPDELPTGPEHGGNRGRTVASGVDLALAAVSLPHALRKGIGRIVTNIKRPQSYGFGSIASDIKANIVGARPGYPSYESIEPALTAKEKLAGLGKMIKAVATDKPIYAKQMGLEGEAAFLLGREVPYRKGFGLKPRTSKELGLEELAREKGWEAFYNTHSSDIYLTNPDGSMRFNPDNPFGQQYLRNIIHSKRSNRPHTGTYPGQHAVMGGYTRVPLKEGQVYDPSMLADQATMRTYGDAGLIDPKLKKAEKLLDLLHPNRDKTISKVGKWEYKIPAEELSTKNINMQMDAIFYNDIWDFDLSKTEIKRMKTMFDDLKRNFISRYIKKVDTTSQGEEFPLTSKAAMKNKEELIASELTMLARDVSRYFMSKIMTPAEIKGTAKYGKPTGKGSDIDPTQIINLEDQDLIWKELVGDYLK